MVLLNDATAKEEICDAVRALASSTADGSCRRAIDFAVCVGGAIEGASNHGLALTDEMTALLQQLRMPETLKYITAVRDKACERLKQQHVIHDDEESFEQFADGAAIGIRDVRENAILRMQLRDFFNTARMAGMSNGYGGLVIIVAILATHLRSAPLGFLGDGVFDILVGCYPHVSK